MFAGTRLKTALIVGSLLAGIIPLATLTLAGTRIFGDELKEQAFSQLESVRDLKKSRIEETLRLLPSLSPDEIRRIMSERSGMGETGETYLVGPDRIPLSEPYLHGGPTVTKGPLKIETEPVGRALAGETGILTAIDYRGKWVLSAYTPVSAGAERWALIAEIDKQEIDRRINAALYRSFLFAAIVSGLLFILFAILLSSFIARGIGSVVTELEGFLHRILRGNIEDRVEVTKIPADFRSVMVQVNALADAFVAQTEERRKLEDTVAFNQRMEAIGMLTGGITHDLNNILGYMLAYADLVQSALPPGSAANAHLDEIFRAIDRAERLVSQITTFSRRMKREKQPVRVAALIGELVQFLQATLPKFITIRKDIADPDIRIMADPVLLHQIFMNLCTNAFHAMQDTGGTLTISLAAEPPAGTDTVPRFRLTVSDTGCGMDDHTRAHAFEPYFTTKPPGQGTGMGLAIVATAVRNLNGTVEIESAVGAGTRISILLPLMPEPEHAGAERPQETAVPGSGTVLFVDDEPHFCVAVRLMLEQIGYDVLTFTDSHQALAAFRENPLLYDVVVSDYNIPDMNGLELARRIKMVRPLVPVVIVTGYSGWDNIREPSQLGIEAVIPKPFSRAQLSRTLAEILSGAAEGKRPPVPNKP